MEKSGRPPQDRLFSRADYRRIIAWSSRIEREAPFFDRHLGGLEPRRVLDVGCGTGEHTHHFAEQGLIAVGIDFSEDMIRDAASLAGPTEAGGSARFERLEAADAADLPETPFGGAICVGNMFAYLETDDDLRRVLGGVHASLAPDAVFVIQLLNYERIVNRPLRHLPLNFRPLPEEEGEGEIVFLRIFTPEENRKVRFHPITLTLRPGADPPIEIRSVNEGRHRAWSRAELTGELQRAGFDRIEVHGGMSDTPFDAETSSDLVLVGRRR